MSHTKSAMKRDPKTFVIMSTTARRGFLRALHAQCLQHGVLAHKMVIKPALACAAELDNLLDAGLLVSLGAEQALRHRQDLPFPLVSLAQGAHPFGLYIAKKTDFCLLLPSVTV